MAVEKTLKKAGNIGEYVILGILALILISSSLATTVQFLGSASNRESIDALVQDSLGIIAAIQKWHRSSSVLGGADREGFEDFSFQKLGFIDGVDPSGKIMYNSNGRYTVEIAEDAQSFSLVAQGHRGGRVVYENVGPNDVPDPDIQ
ncbi:hypothetical protein K8I28_13965 [bacterium]|nr:hypothetical protein [bacterium]